jgi:hypothetical protein
MGGATLTLTRCGAKVLTYYDRRTSKKLLDSKRLVTDCKSAMAAKSKNIEHADVVTETQQNSIASQFVHTYIEMEHSECLCAIASSYAWC